MIQNRSILYEFLRLQKKSHNPSYPTTLVAINFASFKFKKYYIYLIQLLKSKNIFGKYFRNNYISHLKFPKVGHFYVTALTIAIIKHK